MPGGVGGGILRCSAWAGALEDCLAVLRWLAADPNTEAVVLFGDSSGGGNGWLLTVLFIVAEVTVAADCGIYSGGGNGDDCCAGVLCGCCGMRPLCPTVGL